jgi:hypothetical protein
MLTVSIQVYEGSEKIGSCTGMLGNTYTEDEDPDLPRKMSSIIPIAHVANSIL